MPTRKTKPGTHPVPCATTVARLHSHRDRLVSTLLGRIDQEHSWYRALSAKDRSWVGLVAQASISAFIDWCDNPAASAGSSTDIFAVAPRELTKTVSLQQTLQLLRCGVDVIEAAAEVISAPGKADELHQAVLHYSREFAFATAEVYARAAEERGSWDTRLEALVLDALMRGRIGPSLRSRLAALGWTAEGPVLSLVAGLAAPMDQAAVGELRHHIRRLTPHFLVGFHADRCLVVMGGLPKGSDAVTHLIPHLPDGPIVVGPRAADLDQVPQSLGAASAGLDAYPAWPQAPRPVEADELLPERAMLADPLAIAALRELYLKMQASGRDAAITFAAYTATGRSLEGAGRQLYVHPNTVRYRMGKVAEATGWDPSDPREGYVLQHALAYGRLAEAGREVPPSQVDLSQPHPAA